ncbi:MAG: hypothetical protein A2583_11785 [Bdellovibrionales bacterium RIFOXYD1_FULL_53_11]|nr:MAG: hypothetical protein A2583_11785 [Bdellovibrionales bacterium RIFOXYD1_FULL_53_11]
MNKPIGEVVAKNIKVNNEVKEWIEGEMSKWAQTHPEEADGDGLYYLVNFRRLRDAAKNAVQVGCDLQILAKKHIFKCENRGLNPKRALRHCLAALHT